MGALYFGERRVIMMHSKDFPSARIKPNERVRDMDKPSMTNRPDRPVTEKKPLLDGAVDWSKLAFIREQIVERDNEECKELTPNQVETILKLSAEYDKQEPKKWRVNYICLCCEEAQVIEGTKETYQEVVVCPNCNGAMVDKWRAALYRKTETKKQSNKLKVNVDVNTDILYKKLRAMAKHTTALADELEEIEKDSESDE